LFFLILILVNLAQLI